MAKLRIAHIVCDLLSGGGQKSTVDLIRATEEDVENYLILLENKKDYEINDIRIMHVCNNKNIYKKLDILGDYLLSRKLKRLLKDNKIDIAISHMEVVSKVLRFIDIPKIYFLRVDIAQELITLKNISYFRYIKRKSLYKKILNNQNIITISKDIIKNTEDFINPKKIVNIYNPFNFSEIKLLSEKKVELPKDDYIIQIGFGIHRKRQDILLKAFAKIENKTIKLLLLGTTKNEKLLKIINDLKIKERIIFHSFTTNPYPFILNAKLLVISSDREGLPRVIVESLFLKTPVVSTNCDTGPREILTGNLSSYLAEVNNPEDLAEKINMALKIYPQINHQYIESFDKVNINNKYIKYIEEII